MSAVIEKSTLEFLKKLNRNNNREWFNEHKSQYVKAQENVEYFVDGLIAKMNTHDQLSTASGKKSLYRIYNDVRFAKDKAPYNPRFAGYLKRVKPFLRGGYYFWLKPGESRVACGFSYPNPDDLNRVRIDIARSHKQWNELLNSKTMINTFGKMKGELVKTSPRGFSIDEPAIELLRYKQYWFECSFTDREVLSADFLMMVNKTYRVIRPFFDYMSEVLTSDLNGESVLKRSG